MDTNEPVLVHTLAAHFIGSGILMTRPRNITLKDLSSRHRLQKQPETADIIEALASELPRRWRIDETEEAPFLVFEPLADVPVSYRVEVRCAQYEPVDHDDESSENWDFGFRAELFITLEDADDATRPCILESGALHFDDALMPLRDFLRKVGSRLQATAGLF